MPAKKKKEQRRKEAAKQRPQKKLQTKSDEQKTDDVETDAAVNTTEETKDSWGTEDGVQKVNETTRGAEGHQFDKKDRFSPGTMALPSSQEALMNYYQDSEYKNWQKAGLCFYILKEVLEPCVEDVSKVIHNELMSLSKSCGCMRITELCSFCEEKWKAEIEGLVAGNYVIDWRNKDIVQQPKQHWSVAKCFVQYDQKDTASASDCDISPLLTFIINCNRFKANFGLKNQVRNDRNKYIHRGKPKVSNKELQGYKKNMVALLKNMKLKEKADEAEKLIEKVCGVDYFISLKDDLKVKLSNLQGQVDRIHSHLHSDVDPKIKSLDSQVHDLGRMLKELDEKKADISELEKRDFLKEIKQRLTTVEELVDQNRVLLEELDQRFTTVEGRVDKYSSCDMGWWQIIPSLFSLC